MPLPLLSSFVTWLPSHDESHGYLAHPKASVVILLSKGTEPWIPISLCPGAPPAGSGLQLLINPSPGAPILRGGGDNHQSAPNPLNRISASDPLFKTPWL